MKPYYVTILPRVCAFIDKQGAVGMLKRSKFLNLVI